MQLSKKQKIFINLLLNFWKLHQILNILIKNVSLIAYVFTKLVRRALLGKGLKTTVSEHIFTFNMLKAS